MAREKDSSPGCFRALFSTLTFKIKPTKNSVLNDVKDESNITNDKENAVMHKCSGIPCDFSPPGTKACTLEEWLEAPPPHYIEMPSFNPDAIKAIEECIDSCNSELRELSIKIHDHPELRFEEKYAHKVLTEFMAAHGFSITPHYLGLETAWRATWSNVSSSPKESVRTIGFNSEMDALPGIGHACGHNLIAIGGVAAALGTKYAMEKCGIEGRVVLLGTPAEEAGNGKILLIERGAYKEMDACLMMHPTPGPKLSAGTGSSLAIQPIEVEYFGHPAHASGSPWEGQNALDAAFLAYSSISVLRQQMKPTHRVHGIVEGRDWAPNIIPDYAKMRWLVRAPTAKEVEVFTERVKKCFEAAALATACQMKLTEHPAVYDLRQNDELASEFTEAMKRYGGMVFTDMPGAAGGSTDFGNVTYELPALHPSFAIPTVEGGGNHTRQFTDSAATKEAHAVAISVAKGIAVTGLRVLADGDFYGKVRKVFEDGLTLGSS